MIDQLIVQNGFEEQVGWVG